VTATTEESTGEEFAGQKAADEATDRTTTGTGPADTLAWATAVVAGGVAYLLGYLVTVSLFLFGPAGASESLSAAGRFAQMGIVFANAHGVDAVTSQLTPLGRRFSFIDLAAAEGAAIPVVIYLLVPAVVLFGVGFLYVRGAGAVLPAVGTALGYGGAAYLGSLLFTYTDPAAGEAIVFGVDAAGALVTGLVFPLAFAVPGGVFAAAQAGASMTS
jgi:hypothetical protein